MKDAKLAQEEQDKQFAFFFDMAEAMDNGGTRGITSAFTQPPMPHEAAMQQKLAVISSKEDGWKKLLSPEGDTMLIAKPVDEGRRFNIYVSRMAPKPLALRPLFSHSFSLAASGHDNREWVLTSLRCERCEARGRRMCGAAAIARFRCHADSAAANASRSIGVDLVAPFGQDGVRASMCTKCGERGATWVTELTSRNSVRANSKFWQLERTAMTRSSVSHGPCLRFERMTEEQATLVYDAPLGILQAFA